MTLPPLCWQTTTDISPPPHCQCQSFCDPICVLHHGFCPAAIIRWVKHCSYGHQTSFPKPLLSTLPNAPRGRTEHGRVEGCCRVCPSCTQLSREDRLTTHQAATCFLRPLCEGQVAASHHSAVSGTLSSQRGSPKNTTLSICKTKVLHPGRMQLGCFVKA